MKGLTVVAGLALCSAWSFSSALAQQAAPSVEVEKGSTQQQKLDLPRKSVGPTRPMDTTPLKYDLSPEKLAYIKKAEDEVKTFRKEVETYRSKLPPDSDRTEVDNMLREMHTLKEKWQWLKQTRGDDWDMAREQFETLYGDLREEWRDVKRQAS